MTVFHRRWKQPCPRISMLSRVHCSEWKCACVVCAPLARRGLCARAYKPTDVHLTRGLDAINTKQSHVARNVLRAPDHKVYAYSRVRTTVSTVGQRMGHILVDQGSRSLCTVVMVAARRT